MRQLRLGIAGFGFMGERHCARLQQSTQLVPTDVFDPISLRRSIAHQSYHLRAHSDLASFLKSDIDAVLVAAPSGTHFDIGAAVLKAGKHLFMEKPIATTLRDAEELVAIAEARGVKLLVNHNRRWNVDFRRVRAALPEVGKVYYVENRSSDCDPALSVGTADFNPLWRISKALGGSTILDYGTHWIDQILALIPDRVIEVSADIRNLKWGDTDDYFLAHLVFESGARASIGQINTVSIPTPKWIIHGTQGSIVADAVEGEVVLYRNGMCSRVVSCAPKSDLLLNFYNAIAEDAPLLVTSEEVLRVMKIIDACWQSAATGRARRVHV